MTEATQLGKLLLPALRAHMGDWIYYVTVLRMDAIAQRVSVAGDIHPAETLDDLIQRALNQSDHSAQIAAYLQHQEQRFFNSLVLAVYEGEPKWFELEVKKNQFLDPDEELSMATQALLGFLRLEGTEKIFAVDGQHRVTGIKQALSKNPSLGSQEVSVIFIGHENTATGKERTRRLFTTLNRYAKPVTKGEIIALDMDDIVAIVTRRLVYEHPLFKDKKVSTSLRNKNISQRDKTSFTSIVAVYDALDVYLPPSSRGWKAYKRRRPSDSDIDHFYKKAADLWSCMSAAFPELAEVAASRTGDLIAGVHRDEKTGGHLLFRPIGLELAVKVIRHLIDMDVAEETAVQRLAAVPMLLNEWPWVHLLWNPGNRQMITAPENQKTALRLLVHLVGGDLSRLRTSPQQLQEQIAAITNLEEDSVRLTL